MGEALAIHTYAQEYEFLIDDGGGYTPTEAERAMIEDAITGFRSETARPVDEPGEVERLTRERDAMEDRANRRVNAAYASMRADNDARRKAEAALAETRAALTDMLDEFDADEFGSEGQMSVCAKARAALSTQEISAALADRREGGGPMNPVRWPEYEQDARFRCSVGCGTSERRNCLTHNGRLICPRCKYVGTLTFIPAGDA